MLGAVFFMAALAGTAPVIAANAATSHPVATLTAVQPDSGAASVGANADVTLSAVKKLDGHAVAGDTVEWTVAGPGQATLTPASSTTTAHSDTSAGGIASTVFHAAAPGSYVVTATTRKNPECTKPHCASYVSVRYAVDVTATAATASSDSSDKGGKEALVGLAIVGAAAVVAANNHNHNSLGILRTLSDAGGNGQSAGANAPLAHPLLVHAANDGNSVANVAINWSASGGAILSASLSSTDASGMAQIQVLSVGLGPGPITITASRSDAPGDTVAFTATILQSSLSIVSGDGQNGQANKPVPQPLVVEARLGSAPQANIPIVWAVTGGDAAITSYSNGSKTDASGRSQVSLRFGPNFGPVEVTATRADATGETQTFHLVSTNSDTLSIVSGDNQTGPTDRTLPNPLVVEAGSGGLPESGVPVSWTVTGGDATVSSVSNGGRTNASGQSSAVIKFGSTPGPVDITATRTDISGVSQTFHLTSTLVTALAIVSGDNQTGPPNAPLPQRLVVHATNNNSNASGVTILWSATGGATLSAASSVTGPNGQTSVRVTNTGSGFGPITVTAMRADDPTASVQFTESLAPPTMTPVSGGGQSGLIGSMATAPLIVHIVDGAGVPASGQTVTWTVTSGSAVIAPPSSSTTNGSGDAQINFDYGSSPGPIVITASAYSGNLSVNFNETATTANSLLKITGDNVTAAAGTAIPLKVRIQPPAGTTVLSGVPITFAVVSGSGSVPAGVVLTDINGEANTTLTLGLTPGAVAVLAQVSGGVPNTTFHDKVAGTLVQGDLTIVSGDNQVIAPNTASNAMVVELKGNGAPLAGQTINWSASTGTLSVSSSVTGADGRATATITPTETGPIVVTASFPGYAQYQAAHVTFNQNTTLATLPTLTTNDQSVGVALDSACSSLAGVSNPTSQQQDLLNQCLALNASSSVSTAATAEAIHQLLPNVTETQTQTAATATTAQFNNLAQRMTALRSGAQGASFSGLAFANANGLLPVFDAGSALLGATDDDKAKDQAAASFSRWGFFGSGQIGRQDADARGTTPGYNLDIHGLTFGADYRESDSLVLGGAIGYTRQTTDLNGGQGDLSMNGWSLSGYATWYRKNNWYMDSSLTWADNNYDSRRHIAFALPLPGGGTAIVDQLARASSGGNNLAGSVTFGRDFNSKAWAYGFYGKAQYSHQSFDGFEEHLNTSLPGSGLGLRVDSRTQDSLASVLGGKVDYNHSTSWGVWIPHAEFEWQHEFESDPNAFRAFFVNDPSGTPILVKGDAVDSNFFRLGLGMSFVFTHGRSGFILYNHTIGRTGITEDNLSLGFRMEF